MTSKCYVWKWLEGAVVPVVAGVLTQDDEGNQLFNYGKGYLALPNATPIYQEELPLKVEIQSPFSGLRNIACIRDASPDAWGRRVIINRLFSPKEGDKNDSKFDTELSEITYLLESASDRVGSLDFQESPTIYVPRFEDDATLEDLYQAADKVLKGEPIPKGLESALMHGTSIGGARPKSMLRSKEAKYIAKFSSSDDTYDVVKSEFVAMRLAKIAGLNVAEVKLEKVLAKDALIVTRFDRTPKNNDWCRHSIISALTVLELDETWAREASYPNLIEKIKLNGTTFKSQAKELFSRMVFNVLIGNTDDHARNHAFFLIDNKIELTPAYDICPQDRAGGEASHGMKLTHQSNLSKLSLCLETANNFGLSIDGAEEIIVSLIHTISDSFDDICKEAKLSEASRNVLWKRAVLNNNIFYGGCEHLMPKE